MATDHSGKKRRLDQLLVERGLAESRSRAQALILAGKVRVGDQVAAKAGHSYPGNAEITIVESDHPYVSRGGLKLARALESFGIDVAGVTAIDVGASTGGFTDCLLQNGAARVYAIDVGTGQIHWRLRNDDRVVVLEGRNARYLDADEITERFDLAVIDVSFISLRKILPAVLALLRPTADVVMLVKPQFEADRHEVGKNGVVRDPAVHVRVLDTLWSALSEYDLVPVGLVESPIRGPKGNREFLLAATTRETPRSVPAMALPDFEAIVAMQDE